MKTKRKKAEEIKMEGFYALRTEMAEFELPYDETGEILSKHIDSLTDKDFCYVDKYFEVRQAEDHEAIISLPQGHVWRKRSGRKSKSKRR